jgi:hypothetical protein
MTIGFSLLLIAAGAILRYAITADVEGVQLDEVGLILMIVGAIGFVISLLYELLWAGERSRYYRFWDRERYPHSRSDEPPPRY